MPTGNDSSPYYSNGLLEELCEENLKKLKADPNNVTLRLNLAKAYSRLGRFDEAIQELKTCITVNSLPEYWNELGKTYLNAGGYKEATEAFEKVLEKQPKWPDTFFHNALAYRSMGELEKADALLQKAITLNPRYREALNQRAEILEALGNKDEALHYYKKVIALFFSEYQFNESEDYKYDLSVLFDNPEFVDESIKRLRNFVQKNPAFADAHYKLGLALQEKGMKNEAMLCFRRALEINPHFETARKCFWKRT
ncbi:MAG: tetratricopeptide repeat protein [Candidatus Riflebacteria bacterium]|nr:tetratricopeptide repeat protein [Candidatus Riflebacteria bacterium]